MRAKGAWQTLALVLTVYTGTVGASCGNGRCDPEDYYACPQECASRIPPAPCPAEFGFLSQVEQDCDNLRLLLPSIYEILLAEQQRMRLCSGEHVLCV